MKVTTDKRGHVHVFFDTTKTPQQHNHIENARRIISRIESIPENKRDEEEKGLLKKAQKRLSELLTAKDAAITAPPAKVSRTGTSEQARKIAEQLKKSAKDGEAWKVGQSVHLGFGTKGGAGFKGTITKIEGEKVHIKNPEGKTYSGPIKFLTSDSKKTSDCSCGGHSTKDSNYSGGGSKFNEVKRQLAAVGISIKNNEEWEEYIVGGSYHTDDLKDALDTGLAMAKKKSGTKDAEKGASLSLAEVKQALRNGGYKQKITGAKFKSKSGSSSYRYAVDLIDPEIGEDRVWALIRESRGVFIGTIN